MIFVFGLTQNAKDFLVDHVYFHYSILITFNPEIINKCIIEQNKCTLIIEIIKSIFKNIFIYHTPECYIFFFIKFKG